MMSHLWKAVVIWLGWVRSVCILLLFSSPAVWHKTLHIFEAKNVIVLISSVGNTVFSLSLLHADFRLRKQIYPQFMSYLSIFSMKLMSNVGLHHHSSFPLLPWSGCLSVWAGSSCDGLGTCPLSSISVLKCMSWVFPS